MRPISSPLPFALLVAVSAMCLFFGWAPRADRFTWFMENLPVFIGVPALVFTHRRFPLTHLLYVLIALHCLVLMVGGYWTYAEVPAGYWVKDWLHLARNPYDRLGHLFQGLVPVLIFREVLLRKGILKAGSWSVIVLLLMTLGLSAAYELLEWQTAVWQGASADAFLGSQGDVWDTQWDMGCALIGASLSLAFLARHQDSGIADLERRREELAEWRG